MNTILKRDRESKDRKFKDTKCPNRLGICTRIRSGKTGFIEHICRCNYDLDLIKATKGTSHNCDCGEVSCKYLSDLMITNIKVVSRLQISKRIKIYG